MTITASNIDPKQWRKLRRIARQQGHTSKAGAIKYAIVCALDMHRNYNAQAPAKGT